MDNEIKHYGVLGMKWGVSRGRSAEAYEKASKKLRKLDNKARKAQNKAYNKYTKDESKKYGFFADEEAYNTLIREANEAQTKANKYTNKARRWYESMEKVFSNTDIQLTQEQINMGKSYVDKLYGNSQAKYLKNF